MTEAEKKILNIDYTTDTPYVYVFVRRDIPLVQQIVQSSHACHHAGQDLGAPSGCHLVLFQVADQHSLISIGEHFVNKGVPFHAFYEPDPIWGQDETVPMGYSALCTKPLVGEERRIMEAYDLWYEEVPQV